MDLSRACINCGIAIRERIRRHAISSLPPDMTVLLTEWLTYEVRPINVMCHACYMRAKREEARRRDVDASRFGDTEGNQSIEEIQVPEPPPLPPAPAPSNIQNVPTITLPNYRRCANTSRRCIFDECQNSAGHLVPTIIKMSLLVNNKLYVPRCARVCEEHLFLNNWELLLENESLLNTFTPNQIEIMLDSKMEDNVLDFENVHSMPNHLCHFWTGRTTQEFLELYNSIPIQSVVRKGSKSALAMLLIKYRTGDSDVRISSLFRVSKSTLQSKMNLARKCLTNHFVPLHLGVSHITPQQVAERNTLIPTRLFGNPHESADSSNRWAIFICDGTYLYVQKSSNYKYQKDTYSLHKFHNLTKPFLIVSCDGYIIDVLGPFAATQTDAEIMNSLVSSNGPFYRYFRQNDVFILDRGFRDSVANLEALGFKVHAPESRDVGETQLTALQANKSRCVTLCRWVVEIVNGRFKRDYKLFRNVYFNLASLHMMEDFKIAAALINKFHKVLEDPENAEEIARIATSKLHIPNYLGQFIMENNLNRRRVIFTRIDADVSQINNFPHLDINDLKLIALGPYQVQQARSYYGEHIRERGYYEVQICPELEFSQELVAHIGGNHPVLLRGRIKSRHISRKEYYTYVIYDEQPSNPNIPRESILGYWCSCVAGNRTVGCCAHTMTILWYMGWARHQNSVHPPAEFLDSIIITLND